MVDEELNKEKELAFFASSVDAWFNSSLEHDKSILTLSAGGIGVLSTILTTIGAPTLLIFGIYVLAISCLTASLYLVLKIFRLNKVHIQDVLASNVDVDNPVLRRLDLAMNWTFWLGLFFTAIVGILSAFNSYQMKHEEAKEKIMENDKQTKSVTRAITGDSVNGMQHLTKSFAGMSGLRPGSNGTSQASTPAQTSQASTSNTSTSSTSSTSSNETGPR